MSIPQQFLHFAQLAWNHGNHDIGDIIAAYREYQCGYRRYNDSGGIARTCLFCGNEFMGRKDKQFCNSSCYTKYHRRLKNDSCATAR